MFLALVISTMFFFNIERPAFVVAQGMQESHMNQFEIGKYGERGAFQVREKYWGRVPRDLKGQIIQNEKIVGSLHKRYKSWPLVFERYNGKGKDARRYSTDVISKVFSIHYFGYC